VNQNLIRKNFKNIEGIMPEPDPPNPWKSHKIWQNEPGAKLPKRKPWEPKNIQDTQKYEDLKLQAGCLLFFILIIAGLFLLSIWGSARRSYNERQNTALYYDGGFDGVAVYNVEVVRVIDGDTFVVNIHNWPDIIGKEISVRVKGIDTSEPNSEDWKDRESARRATEFTKEMLANRRVNLINIERGKFFRIVADVYVDGESLSTLWQGTYGREQCESCP